MYLAYSLTSSLQVTRLCHQYGTHQQCSWQECWWGCLVM